MTAEIAAPDSTSGVFSLSLVKTEPDLPGEEWRVHPVHPVLVSNLGRVKSVYNRILGSTKMRRSRAAHGVRWDYVRAGTTYNGVSFKAYNHVLVLETWVGPRPDDHDADHINSDIFDNRLVNLRWRPAAENRATKS